MAWVLCLSAPTQYTVGQTKMQECGWSIYPQFVGQGPGKGFLVCPILYHCVFQAPAFSEFYCSSGPRTPGLSSFLSLAQMGSVKAHRIYRRMTGFSL